MSPAERMLLGTQVQEDMESRVLLARYQALKVICTEQLMCPMRPAGALLKGEHGQAEQPGSGEAGERGEKRKAEESGVPGDGGAEAASAKRRAMGPVVTACAAAAAEARLKGKAAVREDAPGGSAAAVAIARASAPEESGTSGCHPNSAGGVPMEQQGSAAAPPGAFLCTPARGLHVKS